MPQRTIIIGDVHGCSAELDDLLRRLSATRRDRIIFIGDLINKGPDSLGVMRRFWELGARSVLGNHELLVLKQAAKSQKKMGKMFLRRKIEFGHRIDDLVDELSTWPLYIEDPDFIAVHAGLIPGKDPADCTADELCTIRTWDGNGDSLQHPDNPPWFDFYVDTKPVIFGHWAALGGVLDHPRVTGLDTGCVYGKELTALVLPDWEIVSVPARSAYLPVT